MNIEQKLKEAIDLEMQYNGITIEDSIHELVSEKCAEIVKEVALKFQTWKTKVIYTQYIETETKLKYYDSYKSTGSWVIKSDDELYALFLQEVYGEGNNETNNK